MNKCLSKFFVSVRRKEGTFHKRNSLTSSRGIVSSSLLGTNNVRGQISVHILKPNGDYCLYYPSNIFRNTCGFENWGIFSDIPQF